jgi:hypothetical protein
MLIKFSFSLNYILLNAKNNVFIKNQTLIIIYVDNLIMTKFDSNIISILKRVVNEQFEMSDLNFCTLYLDIMIFKNRNLRKLILDQNVYVEQMLRNYEMWDCKFLIIFINIFCHLIKILDDYIINKNFKINYQSIINSLMYVMLNIKLDIIYLIAIISKYAFNSIQIHWQTIKRIFRYLRETYQMKLMFQKSLKCLKKYTNFDKIDDQNIKELISNYVFNINNETINWLSKR